MFCYFESRPPSAKKKGFSPIFRSKKDHFLSLLVNRNSLLFLAGNVSRQKIGGNHRRTIGFLHFGNICSAI